MLPMIAWVVLWLSVAVVFYLLVGYPILLSLVRWRTGPAVRKDLAFQPAISVVIAVYNGAAFIRHKLNSLRGSSYPRRLIQIVVVSDGSTDSTDSIVTEFADQGVTLLRVPRGGKAAALNAALPHATGEIVLFTDVRQPFHQAALAHLAANFADPTVGSVTGELRILTGDGGEHADMDLYWAYELWARKRHSRIDSLLNTTGCIYAMRRELVQPIAPDTLTDDAVIPLSAFFRGYRVIFDPEAIAYDYPAVPGTEFHRRMRTLAGLWQVSVRLPVLFTGSNRMRLHFLSHKFGRVVLPWAMLAIVVSTLLLPPSPFRTLSTLSEGVFLLIAMLDRFIPKHFWLKRISSPARTFLLMNVAAAASLMVFFVPATRLWNPTRVVTKSPPGSDRAADESTASRGS